MSALPGADKPTYCVGMPMRRASYNSFPSPTKEFNRAK
jgi:hypothetical protein